MTNRNLFVLTTSELETQAERLHNGTGAGGWSVRTYFYLCIQVEGILCGCFRLRHHTNSPENPGITESDVLRHRQSVRLPVAR